jgi:ribosomal protein S18 acetylase RimI-like enzyme
MQPIKDNYFIMIVTLTQVYDVIDFLNNELTEQERIYFPCTIQDVRNILDSSTDYAYIMKNTDTHKIMAYGHTRTFNGKFDIPALGIAVSKNFRGLGLGKELCLFMLDILKDSTYDYVMLKVNKENKKAFKLYLNLGFVMYNWDSDFIWMHKKL